MKSALIILALLFTSCGGLSDRVASLPWRNTDGGVRLKYELPVSTAKQIQIENGIAEVVRRGKCLGYKLEVRGQTVAVLKPDAVISGVGAINYNGQDVAGVYLTGSDILVLVDQPNMTEIAMHEMSHKAYYLNDRAKYEATVHHVWGVRFELPDC